MALQNPPKAFLWGPGGAALTPEQIALQQALDARRANQAIDTSPVDSWTQGAARVVDALGGVLRERRTNAAAEENNQYNSDLLGQIMGDGIAPQQGISSPGAASELSASSPVPSVTAPLYSGNGAGDLGAILSDPNARAKLPAGMRNNNPGNIKFVGQKVPGIVGPSVNTDQGDPQAVFDSPESGMNAMYRLASKKYEGGKRTPNQLIAGAMGWTPGNYSAAKNVASSMGIGPNDDINMNDPSMAAKFIRGLIVQEHGKSGAMYPESMILSAIIGQAQPQAPQTAPIIPVETASLDQAVGMQPPVPALRDPSVAAPTAQAAIEEQMSAPASAPAFDDSRFGPRMNLAEMPPSQADLVSGLQAQAAQQQAQPAAEVIPPQASALVESQPAPSSPTVATVAPSPVATVAQAIQAAPQPATAPAATQPQGINSALIRAITDPRANPQTKQIAQILIQQQQQKAAAQAEQQQWLARQQYETQQKQSDPAYQLGLRKTTAELRNLEDPNSQVPEGVRALDLRAQRAGLQPGTPQYAEFMTTGGSKGIQISNEGAIPAGMQAIRDAAGRITRYEPIPGSQAALEAAAFADKTKVRNDLKDVASDTVVSSIDKALAAVDAPGLSATGTIGGMVSGIAETNAAELRRQIGTIKSNITLDSLNAARAASPTGAALGAVSDKDGEILANKLGSIDPSSPNFKRDIRDVQKAYLQTIYGSDKGSQLFEQSVSLGDARAAIAKGAPREAVIKRLQDAGIDAAGL